MEGYDCVGDVYKEKVKMVMRREEDYLYNKIHTYITESEDYDMQLWENVKRFCTMASLPMPTRKNYRGMQIFVSTESITTRVSRYLVSTTDTYRSGRVGRCRERICRVRDRGAS